MTTSLPIEFSGDRTPACGASESARALERADQQRRARVRVPFAEFSGAATRRLYLTPSIPTPPGLLGTFSPVVQVPHSTRLSYRGPSHPRMLATVAQRPSGVCSTGRGQPTWAPAGRAVKVVGRGDGPSREAGRVSFSPFSSPRPASVVGARHHWGSPQLGGSAVLPVRGGGRCLSARPPAATSTSSPALPACPPARAGQGTTPSGAVVLAARPRLAPRASDGRAANRATLPQTTGANGGACQLIGGWPQVRAWLCPTHVAAPGSPYSVDGEVYPVDAVDGVSVWAAVRHLPGSWCPAQGVLRARLTSPSTPSLDIEPLGSGGAEAVRALPLGVPCPITVSFAGELLSVGCGAFPTPGGEAAAGTQPPNRVTPAPCDRPGVWTRRSARHAGHQRYETSRSGAGRQAAPAAD